MSYRTTIGLEIHAELSTETKMFCNSRNDSDETEPNTNICPVCLAHPGTLPVINREAVRHVVRVGTALGGVIADYTEFDRKSYFYPDIPKGYQISQYKNPIVVGGELAGVAITRVHLEEDTARSSHHASGSGGEGKSLVDFNRAGVPLMELVTEPVLHDAKTAGNFARELQQLLRTLGASDANLEKGEMRIEANISVSATDTPSIAYVEVKNINSFRSVERAIEYEIERQIHLLEKGESLVKETRGWDENRGVTFSQRLKEGAADYRYFPEPDLPKLVLSEIPEFREDAIRASLPELPWERRARYESLGIPVDAVSVLVGSLDMSAFFDDVIVCIPDNPVQVRIAANYLVSDVRGVYGKLSARNLAELATLIEEGAVSSRGAKDVLAHLVEEGGRSVRETAERMDLLQVSDIESLRTEVTRILQENLAVVAEFHAGKESVLEYLVGQGMKATRGAGNPGVLRGLFIEAMRV